MKWKLFSAHADYRRIGIMYFARAAPSRLAWKTGCKYVVGCFTTDFLCKSIKKGGFAVFREFNHADYDAENGADLFATAKYLNVKAQLAYKRIAPPLDVMPEAKL